MQMHAWTGRFRIAVAALLLLAAAAAGQDQPAEPSTETAVGAAAEAALPEAMPRMGQVIDAIDKATGDQTAETGSNWSAPVKLAVVFMALAVLPSLLVMMTSFTRIVIVLSFVRRALSTQTIPPNIAIIGLALFLTLFTMSPTFGQINQQALEPYLQDRMTFQDACSVGNDQLKGFMLRQTRQADLKLFIDMANLETPEGPSEVPAHVVIPAFAVSEFRRAFEMGCLLFIPFLLVDLVIAGILLSAGMMMLPPAMISLPFKLILFVLVDGWQMLAETLVLSFQ